MVICPPIKEDRRLKLPPTNMADRYTHDIIEMVGMEETLNRVSKANFALCLT